VADRRGRVTFARSRRVRAVAGTDEQVPRRLGQVQVDLAVALGERDAGTGVRGFEPNVEFPVRTHEADRLLSLLRRAVWLRLGGQQCRLLDQAPHDSGGCGEDRDRRGDQE
jgi:hypothetical protein